MQTTSATWKALWASHTAYLETELTIAGVKYNAFSAPVVARALMQNGLSVGNAISALCEFSLVPIPAMGVPIADRFIVNTLKAAAAGYAYTANIPKSAEVVIRMRLNDGTTQSEWLPAGTYYISRRSTDPITGLVTLQCYDAMLKAEAEYEITQTETMADVVADIASKIGVTVDSRTVINTGADYVVTQNDGVLTMRDVLCGIAAAHGGNWVITPENKLRLVPMVSASDAGSAVSDVVDVDGVLSPLALAETRTITGLRVTIADAPVQVGTLTGIVLDIDCPYMTSGIASTLESMLVGMTYQTYSLPRSVYDPAAELGDYLRSKSDIASVLCVETVTYDLACRGNLTAPDPGEMIDEYPYVGAKAHILDEARGYTDDLDESLDQLDVFNRLTNNGETQGLYLQNHKIYINATYIQTGELVADLIKSGVLSSSNGNLVFDLDNALLKAIGASGLRLIQLDSGEIAFGYRDNTSSPFSDIGHILAKKIGNAIPSIEIATDTSGAALRLYSHDDCMLALTGTDVQLGALSNGAFARGISVPVASAGPVEIVGGLSVDTGASGSITDESGNAATFTDGILTGFSSGAAQSLTKKFSLETNTGQEFEITPGSRLMIVISGRLASTHGMAIIGCDNTDASLSVTWITRGSDISYSTSTKQDASGPIGLLDITSTRAARVLEFCIYGDHMATI